MRIVRCVSVALDLVAFTNVRRAIWLTCSAGFLQHSSGLSKPAMVLLHIFCGNEEFIYETKVAESVEKITRYAKLVERCTGSEGVRCREVVEIHNTRLRVKRVIGHVRLLAAHGPMKEEQKQG